MTNSQRINLSSLNNLAPSIRRPEFDPRTLSAGIVHLGIGAFHRAHMAFYTQRAIGNDTTNSNWGIRGVSLRSPTVRDQLAPQDFLYALSARENENEDIEIIGSVRNVVYAGDDRAICSALIADPGTKIVSMTITEKGYCHDPATGELDERHPGILSDLENPTQPSTAIGTLVGGLRQRWYDGTGPVTFLSCDNLPSNGAVLERIVRRYVEITEPALTPWIDENVSFPKCMVDRIVPATTDEDRTHMEEKIGNRDESPVIAERFSQWVIEDEFRAGRPSWETAGVDMVDDVQDYETMKLRLLNGPHSAAAYLGYLAGFETVADLMKEAEFPKFLRSMMDGEITLGLTIPAGIDIEAYKDSVLARFSNSALSHQTRQIAMDGSQKLPQRLLGSVRSALEKNLPLDCLALSVAAWMRYVAATDERGRKIDVSDPLADEFYQIGQMANRDPVALVESFLNLSEIFGTDIGQADRFKKALVKALSSLLNDGSRRTVAEYARI